MPWRLLLICSAVGSLGGGVLGLVRGLGHLPTLPFAIIEGGILIGGPSAMVGLLLTGLWALLSRIHGRRT
jgi:hypothetical protein